MVKLLPLDEQLSADLRDMLEAYITEMFNKHTINGYNTIDHELPDTDSLLYVRSAYYIWSAMRVDDRYAVLQTFRTLYTARPNTLSCDEPTLAFCVVFIQELALVLTKAAQWPH